MSLQVSRGLSDGLPNDTIFQQLFRAASEVHHPILYTHHDIVGSKKNANSHNSFSIDYPRFFADVIALRQQIRSLLPPEALDDNGILREQGCYICTLSGGDYAFIVAFYAALSIGAAVAPLANGILVEEGQYFLDLVQTSILITSPECATQAAAIAQYAMSNSSRTITILTAYNHNYPFPSPSPTPATNPDVHLDPSLPAVAIFTSGTTGRPKAAILPRKRFIWDYKIDPSISIPAYRPPHWVGGLQSLTRPFLEGNTIHVVPYGNTNVFWLLFRDVPFESVALTPPVLKELRDYYDKHISILPSKEVEEYLYNFRNRTKRIISSGSMIEQNVLDFWRDTLGKHIIYNAYAMTEAGWITITDLDSTLKHSIGQARDWVTIKLSDGDYGEALIKSPMMFLGYLNNDEANARAFDEEGYFRSGDVLRRVGNEYVYEGRISTDFIFFYGYKIPILEVEDALLQLPYIQDACVLGAPDHAAKELPAAIIRLGPTSTNQNKHASGSPTSEPAFDAHDEEQVENGRYSKHEELFHHGYTLQRIRNDLIKTLSSHKLPALIRYLDTHEAIPRTHNGKIAKRGLLKQFFGLDSFVAEDYSWPRTEYWGSQPFVVEGEMRPWDWCGLQVRE